MARLIDADEFMKEIRKWLGNETDFRSLQEVIAGMPTIDPVKQEWISVRDRLPEEKVKVLVVLGSNIRGKRICIDQRISGNWRGLGCLVTHWMPLPEPPEREGE